MRRDKGQGRREQMRWEERWGWGVKKREKGIGRDTEERMRVWEEEGKGTRRVAREEKDKDKGRFLPCVCV